MLWVAIGLVVVGLLAVVLFSWMSPKKKSREHFLGELETFFEAKREPLEGQDNSYIIKFRFEGEEFIYEDVEDRGFSDAIYKACLKSVTGSRLTLTFTERERGTKIRGGILLASDITEKNVKEAKIQVKLPAALNDLMVHTNNHAFVEKFLANNRVAEIFSKFKNEDTRGKPLMTLKIIDGIIRLDFHTMANVKPSLFAVKNDVSVLEEYLDDLLVLVKALKFAD